MALRVAAIPSNAAPQCSSSLLGSRQAPPLPGFPWTKELSFTSSDLGCATMSSIIRRVDCPLSSSFFARAVEQAASTTTLGGVLEVTQETFGPILEAAGDKLVVVDLYTQWCGPCKIMYPKIVELSQKYTDMLFLKLDCNQENKALAKKLGVKVVPTFKLFKNRLEIGEVKGAKYDELVESIEQARTG